MSEPSLRLGVDLGGTKIAGALLDGSGAVRRRERVPTPRDYEGVVKAVRDLAATLAPPEVAIGMGMPGSVSPTTGLVRGSNTTFLNGRDLPGDLAAASARRVRAANDADCFALSEATDGAAEGARVVFGAILGTGCGGGVVIDGRLIPGAGGFAGEWGHTPLPWAEPHEHPGPRCWCGRRGCMEMWAAGTAFERDDGRGLKGPEITARASAGEPEAAASLARYVSRLGRGLAMICDVIDPAVIVLGGGMSNTEALYPAVEQAIAPWAFTDAPVVKVVRNRHGDSSGVRGAAWLWPADGT